MLEKPTFSEIDQQNLDEHLRQLPENNDYETVYSSAENPIP